MALVACARCRQPFYASCHDGSCIDALCPQCEFGARPKTAQSRDTRHDKGCPTSGNTRTVPSREPDRMA